MVFCVTNIKNDIDINDVFLRIVREKTTEDFSLMIRDDGHLSPEYFVDDGGVSCNTRNPYSECEVVKSCTNYFESLMKKLGVKYKYRNPKGYLKIEARTVKECEPVIVLREDNKQTLNHHLLYGQNKEIIDFDSRLHLAANSIPYDLDGKILKSFIDYNKQLYD